MIAALLAVAACRSHDAANQTSRSDRDPAHPAAAADPVPGPDAVETYLPDDAFLVTYEAEVLDELLSANDGACQAARKSISGAFTTTGKTSKRLVFLVGDTAKATLSQCVLASVRRVDPQATMTEADGATKFATGPDAHWLSWHDHFAVLGDASIQLSHRAAAPARLASFGKMRGAKVAAWTRLPVAGIPATELLVLLEAWDMPREWARKMSGSLQLWFASEADAQAAAAKLRAGALPGATEPALISAIKALNPEVRGGILQSHFTDLTVDLRDAMGLLAPP